MYYSIRYWLIYTDFFIIIICTQLFDNTRSRTIIFTQLVEIFSVLFSRPSVIQQAIAQRTSVVFVFAIWHRMHWRDVTLYQGFRKRESFLVKTGLPFSVHWFIHIRFIDLFKISRRNFDWLFWNCDVGWFTFYYGISDMYRWYCHRSPSKAFRPRATVLRFNDVVTQLERHLIKPENHFQRSTLQS